jgi:hypothetical protein
MEDHHMQLEEQSVQRIELPGKFGTTTNEQEFSASAIIGPEGGTVSVTDSASPICGTELTVPAGALDTFVKITIEEGDHGCDFGLSPSIRLLPDGLRFKRFATLKVCVPGQYPMTLDDYDKTDPAVYCYDETTDRWAHNPAAGLARQGNVILCELLQL